MSLTRKSRETALRMLFQWDSTKDDPGRVKEIYWTHAKADDSVRRPADRLFDAVVERVEEIDRIVQAHAENWRMERMSRVDRNILRAAVCEFLTMPEIPGKAVISEAIEVARKYSGDEAAHFINGVLDAVRRDLKVA
jgi:transcription antitermination protein NusB